MSLNTFERQRIEEIKTKTIGWDRHADGTGDTDDHALPEGPRRCGCFLASGRPNKQRPEPFPVRLAVHVQATAETCLPDVLVFNGETLRRWPHIAGITGFVTIFIRASLDSPRWGLEIIP